MAGALGVALVGIVAGLGGPDSQSAGPLLARGRHGAASRAGASTVAVVRLVLIGVLALRAAVIFSAQ